MSKKNDSNSDLYTSQIRISELIKKYTVQLYYHDRKETLAKPYPIASGVFIEIASKKFMLSAAHVLNNFKQSHALCFYVGEDVIEIVEPVIKTPGDQLDKTDIVVYELGIETIKDVETFYSFYKYKKTNLGKKHHVYGFPIAKSKVDKRKQKVLVEPFFFSGTEEESQKTIKRLGFNNDNLLLQYRQMKLKNTKTGAVVKNAAPNGISGCGTWVFNGERVDISGIVIEYNDDKSHLIATRISTIIEMMSISYPFILFHD